MINLIFSIVIIAILISDIFFVEFESFWWAGISLVLVGSLLYWSQLWGVADFVTQNIKLCVIYVIGYVVAGIIWSFIKWYSYLIHYRDQFTDIKNNVVKLSVELIESQWAWLNLNQLKKRNGEEFLKKDLPFDTWTEHSLSDLYCKSSDNRCLYNNYNQYLDKYKAFAKPIAADNKTKIVAWMCYWPWSLLGTFISDPLRRLVEFLFKTLKNTYQKMSDRVFVDFPDKNDV